MSSQVTTSTGVRPLYALTCDQLVTVFSDTSQPADVREQARLEFDAKTDAVEGR